MPVRPNRASRRVGIDVAAKASETLSKTWPDRMPQDPALDKLGCKRRIGRKAKKGFYFYESERRGGPDPEAYRDLGLANTFQEIRISSPSEIQDRLVLPMINEAAYCLSEGGRREPAKLDLAMIFGTGFPPFRGGLCAHATLSARRRSSTRCRSWRRKRRPGFFRAGSAPDRNGAHEQEILPVRGAEMSQSKKKTKARDHHRGRSRSSSRSIRDTSPRTFVFPYPENSADVRRPSGRSRTPDGLRRGET